MLRSLTRCTAALLWAVWLCTSAQAATPQSGSARVVHVQGQAEQQHMATPPWHRLRVDDTLPPNTRVRTGQRSQLALLLDDETQIRLSQNTLMEIKAVANQRSALTDLLISVGRAWTQTLRPANSRLQLSTPTATIGIRGTDWDVEVAPSGNTLLTVFSGTVEFGNELGQITVTSNEAAVAEVGKAPVKLLLTQPRDRIQWVNALVVEPRRHLGPDGQPTAATPWLLASEQLLVDGAFEQAAHTLRQGLAALPAHPDLVAQLARVHILSDRVDQGVATLSAATGDTDNANLWLVRGLLARRQGQNDATLQAFARAIERAPNDDRGWFGLGSAHTEREDTAPARANLHTALRLAPTGPGYLGELGTLETFSNQFAPADAAFAQALANHPADYVALTGLGLLRLKQGQPQAALDHLLRAGVMEPRYARAKTYTAVAYWQLGRHRDALATLAAASQLDDKDPVPHLLLAQMHTDLYQPGEAVQASRQAMARMPYLKSLNQLANDQQGRANLGSSLAFFGMEDWALELAQQGKLAYWGGSHLFLADRYTGDFNKNSQLFKGFLSDPLAFGASNRFSPLVQRPGDHASVDMQLEKNRYELAAPAVTLNGLHHAPFPITYFIKTQRALAWHQPIVAPAFLADGVPQRREQGVRDFYQADGEGDIRANLSTLALGARPTEKLGLFGYWHGDTIGMVGRHDINPYSLYTDTFATRTRLDFRNAQSLLGLSYRWAPQSQTWLLVGQRSLHQRYSDAPALWLRDNAFATLISDQRVAQRISELQLQHTADLSSQTQLSLGFDFTRERQQSSALSVGQHVQRDPATDGIQTNILGSQLVNDFERRFLALRVGMRHQWTPALGVEGKLVANRLRLNVSDDSYFGELLTDENGVQEDTPISYQNLAGMYRQRPVTPQLGMVFQPSDQWTLRAAYQDWLRPLGVGTLDSVETAGLPVEDHLVKAGGRYRRSALQASTAHGHTFLSARVSHARVQNPAVRGIALQTPAEFFLTDLRNAQIGNLSALTLLEDTPTFQAATVQSTTLSWSQMFTPRWSAYTKYLNQQAPMPDGRVVPFIPRHTLALGATWVSQQRLYVNARAVYRSQRFADAQNLYSLPPGWRLDLLAFMESADKRWGLGAGALNLGGSSNRFSARRYVVNLRYRF